MYRYSDDRPVQFNFNRQKSGQNRAFRGHWSSPVFLTDILKYTLDRQIKEGMLHAAIYLQLVSQQQLQEKLHRVTPA